MQIGKIIGRVVATRKDETLVGSKLMITQPLDINLKPDGKPIVAVDSVGAGIDEIVIYATGAAARNALRKNQASIDTAIVGIVDSVDIEGD